MVCLFTYIQITILISLSSGAFIRRRSDINLNVLPPVATNTSDLVDQASMDMPWEQLIVSGPMTVHLLGQLIVLSTKLDFSFVNYSSNYQFEYILYPQSFRTTLIQIANDAWKAFLAAHTNMNQIQLYMQLIPGHVKTAFKVLTNSASTRLISNLIPRILTEIKTISNECVTLSSSTHQTFVNVINLLGEVISVTEVSRGVQETRLKQTEIELNVSRVMQEELNKLGEMIKGHFEETRHVVRQAQSEYSKALSRIPSGFKGMVQDLVRTIQRVISKFSMKLANGKFTGSPTQAQDTLANAVSLAYCKSFKDGLDKLSRTVSILFSPSTNGSSSVDPLEELDALKITFESYLGSMSTSPASALKSNITEMLEEGIALANDFLILGKRIIGRGKSEDGRALQARLVSLQKRVEPLAIAEAVQSESINQKDTKTASLPDSRGNEVMIARMQGEFLQRAQKRYDAFFGQLQSQQEQMSKLMTRIATLDLTRINYTDILALLREALLLLGKVREQWNQLVLFFADIAARAEIALSGTVDPFIEQVTQASAQDISRSDRLFYVDLLKSQAAEINKEAHTLFIMSRTYVDMSDRYLLKRLGGLPQLLTAQNEPDRARLLTQLSAETAIVQKQVAALVNERKNSFKQAIAKRQGELDVFIQNMGGVSQQQLNVIEEAKEILEKVT